MGDHGEDDDLEADPGGPEGLDYRRRGRPRQPEELKRREKVIIALTGEELRDLMHRAADAKGGPIRLQEYCRRLLLNKENEP